MSISAMLGLQLELLGSPIASSNALRTLILSAVLLVLAKHPGQPSPPIGTI